MMQFDIARKCMKIGPVLWMGAVLFLTSCHGQTTTDLNESFTETKPVLPGIFQIDSLAQTLLNSKVGVVGNHTSFIENTHLVDSLLSLGVSVQSVFAPEHGFRGNVPDGDEISDQKDKKTGLPIVSLYGKSKKPSKQMLDGIDVMIFDIQDVGVRFYTYLSTMHYVMEACAENDVKVIVLDRPNPHGHYTDGPVLNLEQSSFVGLHPVPVVYGLTIGEYAQMINGEGWLDGGVTCDLEVVECLNYTHNSRYDLPIKPSPNLPDMTAIYLYPSLGFFEGTIVSAGRGTDRPFTLIGEPGNKNGDFEFTPRSIKGASTNPKFKGENCRGYNLAEKMGDELPLDSLDISWLLRVYAETQNQDEFFLKTLYFDKLAGNTSMRQDVLDGKSEQEIRKSWEDDLRAFELIRQKYVIYP